MENLAGIPVRDYSIAAPQRIVDKRELMGDFDGSANPFQAPPVPPADVGLADAVSAASDACGNSPQANFRRFRANVEKRNAISDLASALHQSDSANAG